MKKTILMTLILIVFSCESISGQSVRPRDSYEEYYEFVRDVKRTITIERSHKIGTEEEMVLEPGQAARLNFEANPSGVKEFILFYDDDIVNLAYCYTNDTEEDYQVTSLEPERKKAFRGTSETDEGPWLWLFYEYEPKDGKAFVKFRTTLELSEKDEEQMEEIEKHRKAMRRQDRIDMKFRRAKILEEIREKAPRETPYEFGTVKEVTIVPDQKAAQLKCSDNPEGVEEILIGANPKHLYIYCVLSSGSTTGGGGTWGEGPGSFRQVGGSAAIGMWEPNGEKINLKFQLTDDGNTMVRAWRTLEKAGKSFREGGFSTMIQNWNTLLGDTELLFDRLTPAQRAEAFTRLWSTMKFNFANFDLVPELEWDDILSEYLPKAMRDQSNDEYVLLLQECVALLKDGHTSVGSRWGNGMPIACPPLRIRSVGGKAIIAETTDTEEIKASGIKPGDEITHVDGRPVQELLEKDIYPYICASTPQGRDLRAYPTILGGNKESRVALGIRTLQGGIRSVSLTRKASGLALLGNHNRGELLEYKDLGVDLAYVALNGFGDDYIVDDFIEKFNLIKQAKGLIIDVRENGGGSSGIGHEIVAHLIDKGIQGTHWKTPQYRAAFRAWGRDEEWHDGGTNTIEPETDDPFLGPVVVLIGSGTNSAAEDFVVPLHAAGRATIVGQRSRGSTGQPLRFSFLDGKINGRVCTKRDTYPDGREFVGVGIIPDVEVGPTPADIAAGRDVVLEKGIEVLHSQIKRRFSTLKNH
ncbi:MAG: S41 family peptidase [Planctomycetota bacterium]|jgi:C-terminal processing protease CtpA/Prc